MKNFPTSLTTGNAEIDPAFHPNFWSRFSSVPFLMGTVITLLFIVLLGGCAKEGAGIVNVCVVPTVLRTNPGSGETNVALNKASAATFEARTTAVKVITATFSTPMNGNTITPSTFIVTQGTDTLTGSVSYSDTTAVFIVANDLQPNLTYTCTLTTGIRDLAGTALANNYVWSFTTFAPGAPGAPVLVLPVATAQNQPTSLNLSWLASAGASTYRLQVSTNSTFVTTLFNDSTLTGTSQLISGLSTGTTYYWRVNAKNASGTSAYSARSFTTLVAALGVPTLVAPADLSTNVSSNPTLSWNPATGAQTYRLQVSTGNTFVTTVFNDSTLTGTSQPVTGLTVGTTYFWRVNAKNLSGTSAYSTIWRFTVAATPSGSINLGKAATFGSIGGNAGVTNQGIFTQVNGSIGTTAASTLVTGFHDGTAPPSNSFTETPLNRGTVRDTIYTSTAPPGSVPGSVASQSLADAQTAYNTLKGLPPGADPNAGELGGLTLAPGTYTSAGGTFKITLVDLTLDAQGDPNARFVFQMASSLTVGAASGPRNVTLINGAQAKNVYWVVGTGGSGAATINAAGGGDMVGTIIAYSGVTFSTAGNVTLTRLEGRALGLNASVTLVNTIINVPAP